MMLKAVLRNWKRWQGLLRGPGGIVGAMVFGGTLTLGSLSLAGDLLRGGATFGSTPAVTPGAATSPAQAQARANAADLLSKTTQALKAVQAMQAAAQNAAASASNAGANPNAPGQTLPNVPNGLVPGGLQVAPGATSGSALWSGANLPTQSGNAVTVKQNSSQALLHWQTFNVGQNTKLFFDQSAGGAQASQWIAFNMVNDPSGVPSQILGSIQAAGQVYVINQNGIIFGGASQVNVHTLVASSLPINTSLISNGLLNNPDAQFLFSALPQAAGTFGPTPAFTPPAPPNTPNGELGAVTVQAGATITSPASAANVGGRVALIGPNVTNNGTINTPDGQTILAAGLQVGFAAHATSDASLRGLDVYVGAISDPSHPAQGSYAGTVTNNGIININEASVVMAGKTVNQNGIISGASSVSLNGRIDLLAQYNATSNVAYDNDSSVVPFFFASTGAVNLGTGSVTQILPDLSSTSTIVPTMTNGVNSLALSSEVNLQGLTVHLASGSILWAPGGAVNVNAGQYQLVGGVETFVTTAGQIYLDAGAMINTAGEVDVSTPLSDVIDQVQLRGPQLQDQALQRNGALRGQTITVDLRNSGMFNGVSWVGTPLADLSGYAGTVQYSATQLSINGGAVKLNAGGSVVVQNGATVNVSGGWANYPSGMVQTTRLLTMNGQLVDIAQATPDMVYQGVYTGQFTTSHPAWGIALSQTFTVPWMTGARNEAAYSAGGNGGSIYISAPTVALDGSFLGSTITGPRQQSQAPSSSSFTLNLAGQAVQNQALLNQFSPAQALVILEDGQKLAPAAPFATDSTGLPLALSPARQANVVLSPDALTGAGFGSITVDNPDGAISIPAKTSIVTAPGGSLSLTGANIDVEGSISVPAGKVSLTANNLSPFTALQLQLLSAGGAGGLQEPTPTLNRGLVTVGPSSTISTAGLIIDNRASAAAPYSLVQGVFSNASGSASTINTTTGGSISVNAYSANLSAGSVLDVSGGVLVSQTGAMTYGNAGSITINTGKDPGGVVSGIIGGTLQLGSTLKGYSGAVGGSLSIQATLIQVGGHANLFASDPIVGAFLSDASQASGGHSLSANSNWDGLSLGPPISGNPLYPVLNPSFAPLILQPDFFSQGGFTNFSLAGIGLPIEQIAQAPASAIVGKGGSAASTGADQIQLTPAQQLALSNEPAVLIAPNTTITPIAQSWLGLPHQPGAKDTTLSPILEPVGVRTPVSLSFNAPGLVDINGNGLTQGNIELATGASIQTDPLASVSFKGQTVSILGSVVAPGGTITVKGANKYPYNASITEAQVTVFLGPQSELSAAGATLVIPNKFGQPTGQVLPGGTITVSGNIVAMAGSVLDVSGASGMLDETPASLGLNQQGSGPLTSPVIAVNSGINAPLYSRNEILTRVDSNGGSITLTGAQEMFTDATLLGAAGGPTAAGGTLTVSSGRFYPGAVTAEPYDINLQVTQSGPTIPTAQFYKGAISGVGFSVSNLDGSPILGMGYFTADAFSKSGFDSLNLGGNVMFSGPVSISAGDTLSVATSGVLYANNHVTLNAPYVSVGIPLLGNAALNLAGQVPLQSQQLVGPYSSVSSPLYLAPTFGPGQLTINASFIDVGSLSLQDIGVANFNAKGGDIRGAGTLDIQGTLNLNAAQIYPASAFYFTMVVYDYAANGVKLPGTINISASGVSQFPLSAGGQLNVYATQINQNGVLLAPYGAINIGYNGTGAQPTDLLAGNTLPFPMAQQITLGPKSITSTAGVNPFTGEPVVVPYGLNLNGISWIDPTGLDITASGPPVKTVTISGQTITAQAGSVLNIQGGGDLYAYRFLPGLGGTNDILASNTSFAVIPGYTSPIAPVSPFNNTSVASANIGGDLGYVNSSLQIGQQIYLDASNGLAAGYYTLLPARYANLPGAVLVTPISGAAIGTVALPDGSSIVSGHLADSLTGVTNNFTTRFDVAPQSVVAQRAEYDSFYASTFFPPAETALNVKNVTRLPQDAGHLILEANVAFSFEGNVQAQAPDGRPGLVDISSTSNILITGGPPTSTPGTLVLSAGQLSGFGAESLLIGGVRQLGADGVSTTVTVYAPNITVSNSAGSPLEAPEVILAANNVITVTPGSVIKQKGTLADLAEMLAVNEGAGGAIGDGTLLRVSSDPKAAISRSDVTGLASANLVIGDGAQISGVSVILDSTYGSHISPDALIKAQAITLDSGRITIAFANGGTIAPTTGLVLTGALLQSVSATPTISLLSYSSIDIYGTGTFGSGSLSSLSIHAGEIRGFNTGGGAVSFAADAISLDNSSNAVGPGPITSPSSGTLEFIGQTIQIGSNKLSVDQFANLNLTATNQLNLVGAGGLATQGNLAITTPSLIGQSFASQTLSALGAITVQGGSSSNVAANTGNPPVGASLTLQGATINVTTTISMPSGEITFHATSGDLDIGSRLDVSGTAQNFYDVAQFTSGGVINLIADNGSVNLTAGSTLAVNAQPGGGNGGTINISATKGTIIANGALKGAGGAGGLGGSFTADAGTLTNLGDLNTVLGAGDFSSLQSIRVRSGDVLVSGTATSSNYSLSTDNGSITVQGTINAAGAQGGSVTLSASGSVTLLNGSKITVAGQSFSDAGKGGSVSLEAGSEINGVINTSAVLDIQTGSTIDLSVSNYSNAPTASIPAGYQAAPLGDFTGTLLLRAPQNSGATDVAINAINGNILNPSSVIVEGYVLYNLTTSGAAPNVTSVQNNVSSNGSAFAANASAIFSRLTANNPTLANALVASASTSSVATTSTTVGTTTLGNANVLQIEPGAEIINMSGDLALGSTGVGTSGDWNLSTFRFGANGVPGILTLRASGNLIFNNTLSDGFTSSAYTATLLPTNSNLPLNNQSWSYQLVAGADFAASNAMAVVSASRLATGSGSLELGRVYLTLSANTGDSAQIGTILNPPTNTKQTYYQVIRTGSGNIDIATAADVDLFNPFATIYTAGVLAPDQTLGGTFTTPTTNPGRVYTSGLGPLQEKTGYAPQYSMAGGNVVINAQGNIQHETTSSGQIVPDTEYQLPNNWLYRRGYVDPSTGLFGAGHASPEIASTTWWIDFSNFFEGVGALGGGNVTMNAGGNINNVDAVIPTNARMPGLNSQGQVIGPSASSLVILGGGDLVVHAGGNLNAGVYYVEQGLGTITAGGSIVTNGLRAPVFGANTTNPNSSDPNKPYYGPSTWLPTMLVLGTGSFDVSARGDVLLGPVVDTFLMPEGYSNLYYDKTYFSTYGAGDAVNVSSLGGDVTLRTVATLPQATGPTNILDTYLAKISLYNSGGSSSGRASNTQPWLRLDETEVSSFNQVITIMPPTLNVTAYTGNINIVGNITLSPASQGQLQLLASGSISALQPNGISTQIAANSVPTVTWAYSSINLSDANPSFLPGVTSPYSYQLVLQNQPGLATPNSTLAGFLNFIGLYFNATGATTGSAVTAETEHALHDASILHAGDSTPAYIYALSGDISGLAFYSAKPAEIIAGRDITDVSFYVQNTNASSITTVSAGRDIIAYDPNSSLLQQASSSGNLLARNATYEAGDIQISGPGTLEVLAGRNLNLGVTIAGTQTPDGTGLGITSIGNTTNPALPYIGADIIAAAGLGSASVGLASSSLDAQSFITQILEGPNGSRYLTDFIATLASNGIYSTTTTSSTASGTASSGSANTNTVESFFGPSNSNSTSVSTTSVQTLVSQLPAQQQAILAVDLFMIALRDAGRDFNDPTSPNVGSYANAYTAISTLVPQAHQGSITATSREITTTNGGNITVLNPGGTITVGLQTTGTTAATEGILTDEGGNISIFSNSDVNVGISRIFTLKGGSISIWSTTGNIDAGSASKTVLAAPPTRVLIDPQSADVQTDLSGLATGGGIGVLETVMGVPPGNVDLIAPVGTVNAEDAGIRASGNLNIAAAQVLNASNIQVGGASVGTPAAAVVATPNIAAISAGNTAAGQGASAAQEQISNQRSAAQSTQDDTPSVITVEVLGYGGGDTGE